MDMKIDPFSFMSRVNFRKHMGNSETSSASIQQDDTMSTIMREGIKSMHTSLQQGKNTTDTSKALLGNLQNEAARIEATREAQRAEEWRETQRTNELNRELSRLSDAKMGSTTNLIYNASGNAINLAKGGVFSSIPNNSQTGESNSNQMNTSMEGYANDMAKIAEVRQRLSNTITNLDKTAEELNNKSSNITNSTDYRTDPKIHEQVNQEMQRYNEENKLLQASTSMLEHIPGSNLAILQLLR